MTTKRHRHAQRRRAVQSARDARKRTGRRLIDERNPITSAFLARLADEAATELAARRAAKIPIVPLSVLWPTMSRRERIAANLSMAGVRSGAIDKALR